MRPCADLFIFLLCCFWWRPARSSRRAAPTRIGPNSTGGSATERARAKKLKVGLVTDIGGLNDRSFNQLANEGLERAKSELGVETRVLISAKNSDYVPNLSTLAQQKYDLVIGVGFLMAEADGDRRRRSSRTRSSRSSTSARRA